MPRRKNKLRFKTREKEIARRSRDSLESVSRSYQVELQRLKLVQEWIKIAAGLIGLAGLFAGVLEKLLPAALLILARWVTPF
jgi:hypothetical protein